MRSEFFLAQILRWAMQSEKPFRVKGYVVSIVANYDFIYINKADRGNSNFIRYRPKG
jgi:hypothetical protein